MLCNERWRLLDHGIFLFKKQNLFGVALTGALIALALIVLYQNFDLDTCECLFTHPW